MDASRTHEDLFFLIFLLLFWLGLPHLPQRHLGLIAAVKVKQRRTEGLILMEMLNTVLDHPLRATFGPIFETSSQPLSAQTGRSCGALSFCLK